MTEDTKTTEVVNPSPAAEGLGSDTDKPVEALEFPSLVGEPEVEIAKRSADETRSESTTFRKDFVLPKVDFETGDKEQIHENNELAVRQFLINQGLRPVGDQIRRSNKPHLDGVSVVLTYRAKVTPAVVAESYPVAHAHVHPEDTSEEELNGPDEDTTPAE